MELPFVTVMMPVRNEAGFIERSLDAVLRQDYPSDRLEVIVADGMSEDGTREIIQRIVHGQQWTLDHQEQSADAQSLSAACDPIPIILLDNPGQIMTTGANAAVQAARGEILILLGGHTIIPANYVRYCVKVLRETGADCVGGTMVTVGETWSARAIALAQSSLFGVGGAAFRTGRRKPGYVDTLAFGAYRREVFERIGRFDEDLVRNQDDEFNFRLIQAGGRIWLDHSIHSFYYSRSDLHSLWRQYFQYGLYKVRVMQKRNAVPSWRHLVPAVFVLALVFTLAIALVSRRPLWALSVAGPYAVANLVSSVWAARRDWRTLPLLPLSFLSLHLAYGLGFLWGLWRWRRYGFQGLSIARFRS